MPLLRGAGNISRNVRELYEANKSKPKGKRRKRAQIIAIAESVARKKRI